MFAGGSAEFTGTLRVGDTVRREATVESVTEKNGRSGKLVIVVTSTILFAPTARPPSSRSRTSSAARPPKPAAHHRRRSLPPRWSPAGPPIIADGERRWQLRTDPTLLMRFSAATANAHRIHYDWPYATGVEGYPGLVVHGPLMTLALLETHRLDGDARPVRALSHRVSAPLFCGQSAQLVATPTPTGTTVEVIGPGGEEAGPRTTVELTLT